MIKMTLMKTQWLQIFGSSESGICGLVEQNFFRSCWRWTLAAARDLGRCLRTRSEVRPVQGVKNPVVDSLGPVFADRAKISTVQILHKVGLGCHLVGVVCLGHGGKYCWKSLWKGNILEAVVGVPGDEYCGFLKKNWLESCR